MKRVEQKTEVDLIDTYVQEARNITILIYWMKKIFKYIDGVELREEESLFQISHNIFREEVIIWRFTGFIVFP